MNYTYVALSESISKTISSIETVLNEVTIYFTDGTYTTLVASHDHNDDPIIVND